MRILGIDPGLRLTGYASLDEMAEPGSCLATGEPVRLHEAGVLRLGRSGGTDAMTVSARLDELDRDFRGLLDRIRPQAVAVEALFSHYGHPATAIIMGHARGVMLLAVRQAGLTLIELRPATVKKSITGNGQARKDQMQRAVQACFGLDTLPEPPDVADAIAIALCGLRRLGAAALGSR